jgi:hypothetical protein
MRIGGFGLLAVFIFAGSFGLSTTGKFDFLSQVKPTGANTDLNYSNKQSSGTEIEKSLFLRSVDFANRAAFTCPRPITTSLDAIVHLDHHRDPVCPLFPPSHALTSPGNSHS